MAGEYHSSVNVDDLAREIAYSILRDDKSRTMIPMTDLEYLTVRVKETLVSSTYNPFMAGDEQFTLDDIPMAWAVERLKTLASHGNVVDQIAACKAIIEVHSRMYEGEDPYDRA